MTLSGSATSACGREEVAGAMPTIREEDSVLAEERGGQLVVQGGFWLKFRQVSQAV